MIKYNKRNKCKGDCRHVAELKATIEAQENRLKQLECVEHDWEYKLEFDTLDCHYGIGFRVPNTDRWMKTCQLCGKRVLVDQLEYLESKADDHYKKHVEYIDEINELNEEGQ